MSRILLGRALTAAKVPSVWEQQACTAQQQRSFSQTLSHPKPRVLFDETTTPDLAPVLDEIQSNIILPHHLRVRQRKRVFSDKLKHRLKADPVYLEVDGVEHRFSHINKNALPPSREVTWKAMKAMKTHQDWNNFVRLLSGMRNAGRSYSQTDFTKMIRIAGVRGQISTIIEAARQACKTSLRLDNSEKVNEVMHFVQMHALQSDWDKGSTEQALRWCELVLEMLEDPNHAPDGHKFANNGRGWFPLRKDPQILGAALHLSAVLSVKHNDGKDLDGKVATYAEKVADGWPAGKGLLQLYQPEAYTDNINGVAYLVHSRTQYLSYASPILHGLFMAARVVDKPLADRLQEIAASLGSEVKEVVEKQDYPAVRGLKTYDALFGSS